MIQPRFLVSLLLPLLLAAPAAADPGAEARAAAGALLDGQLAPRDAAASWEAAGLSPAAAREALRFALRTQGDEPVARLELEDEGGRRTRAEVVFPAAPRADGRYGVLIALHGLGGRADQLVPFARRVAPPGTIVIAPGAQRLPDELQGEDLPGFGAAAAARALPHWWSYRPDAFPLLALDALLRRYPIDTDRVVLLGYSMGGYGTWNLGLRYPDRFAAIAPLAGGISRLENLAPRDDRSRALVANGRMIPSFVVHGTADRTVPFRFSRSLTEELAELGAEVTFRPIENGPHVLASFLRGDALTAELAAWLADRARDPDPVTVEHTLLADYHGRSYWVRARGVRGQGRVRARIAGEQRIELTADGVRHVTVYLDPDLVDVARPVTVTVDDRVVFHGRVAGSLITLAETFAETRDPELSYAHALELDLAALPRPAF